MIKVVQLEKYKDDLKDIYVIRRINSNDAEHFYFIFL